MRVGYVLKRFPKLSETFVLNEVLALERQGAEVHVFALAPGLDDRFHPGLAELKAPVTYLGTGKSADFVAELAAHRELVEARSWAVTPLVWDLLERAEDGGRAVGLVRAAAELVFAGEPLLLDRLHAHFAGPAAEVARLAAAALGIPYGFTCHARDIYHETAASSRDFRVLHGNADRVITVCEANRRFLEETVLLRDSSKISVVYNGVDLDRFHPDVRLPHTVPTILGVGRLVAKKGFSVLVEAAAILESRGVEFRCRIIGEGRERPDLERRIRAHGLRSVQLLGSRDSDGVREELAQAWVMALPCIVDPDGNRDALPTVLLEALGAGVPAVSTPVTGVAEIVEHGVEGLLVEPGDALELADALELILTDPSLRVELGRAGRRKAEERFDLSRNVGSLLGLMSASAPGEPVVPTPTRSRAAALPLEGAAVLSAGPLDSTPVTGVLP